MLQAVDLSKYLEKEGAPALLEAQEYEKSTLAEWGPRLLIGVKSGLGADARFDKQFAFDKLTFKREKELDKLRGKKGGAGTHPGKTVAQIMSQMLLSWGDLTDFQEEKEARRQFAIDGAYMEDVLYAWIWFRIQILGPILAIDAECGSSVCRHEWEWATDLTGLEVSGAPAGVHPVLFELETPVAWSSKEISHLVLMPPRWGGVSNITAGASAGFADMRMKIAMSAVEGVCTSEGEEYPITDDTLANLEKKDLERLADALDGLFPSSDPRFELECPVCGNKQVTPLQWAWDFFFTSASLPSVMRKR